MLIGYNWSREKSKGVVDHEGPFSVILIGMNSDPIAALATPWGESALAVIRISGEGSLENLAPLFRGRRSLADCPGHTLHFGTLMDNESEVDQVVIAVYRGPHSYTGEDGAEIFCHGGPSVIRRVLATCEHAGFRRPDPGEFTLRAYLNGRMDLTRAEAVNEIIRARTDRARAMALDRLSGAVAQRIDQAKSFLVDLKASIEIHIDYVEEDIDEPEIDRELLDRTEDSLRSLLDTYRAGKLLQEGATVVIAGRPNAGKSTLFNLLLREERAIVSPDPGTTRDYIEGGVEIEGVPLRLIDTAGLRESVDQVEQEGVRRTREVIRGSHLTLFVVDGTVGVTEQDRALIAELRQGDDMLVLWNKVDLTSAACPKDFLPVSATTAEGIDHLHAELAARVAPNVAIGEPVIDSDRQRDLLVATLQALGQLRSGMDEGLPLDVLALDVDEALARLGEITGAVTSRDVIERMFSSFCVGK